MFQERFDPDTTNGQGPYWLKNLYFVYLLELLNLISSFPDHFDETSMFTGGKQAEDMKIEFREHFRNITRVIDCVGCDKCKLWGKLQVTGLGTALKILFSGEFDKPHPPLLLKPKGDLKLTRNEIVALFNSFAKLSQSIVELERFRELLRKKG